jgi:predicted nucleic acid-binding protein
LREAFQISLKRDLTVYDWAYIALAKKPGGALLSRDARQLAAAQAEGVKTQAA